MFRKVYQGLALSCIVATATVALFLLLAAAKGRLTPDNRAALGRILRGEPVMPVVEAPPPPATAPAEGRDVSEQVTRRQEQAEVDNLMLQRRLEELHHQRLQLEALQRQVAQERQSLREERLAWARQIEQAWQDKTGEAFARQLKLFEVMASKQVKDLLIAMGEEQAANYLTAMKRDTAAEIMGRFRQPSEKQFLLRCLERMRQSS